MRKNLIALLFLFSLAATAQAPKKFYTRFGGYGHDIGYGVVQTLNGQYAVTGSTSSFGNGNTDVYLALVDSMGWVRWEKSYGGFNNDIGRSIIQLKDSGFVIAGYTNSFGSGGYDVFAVRTDKNGNLVWQKAFGGFDWDFGYWLREVNNGDSLIICGNTYSFGYGKSDGYIIKTDINGNLQWQKTYGGPEDDEFKSFASTYNNQYAFTGYTKSFGDLKGDTWLFKTGLNGDSVKSFRYGTTNKRQFANKIIQTTMNDFVMCGGNDSTGTDSLWSQFICVDENGNTKFKDAFSKHKFNDQQFMTVVNTKFNDFIYVEKGYNVPSGYKLEPTYCIFGGQWYVSCNTYGSYDDEIIYDIVKTKDRGTISVGSSNGFGANLTDVFLVKMDSTLLGSVKIIGINEISNPLDGKIDVYPSVTSSFITIEIDYELFNSNIIISNSLGQILHRSNLKNTHQKIDLSEYPTGFYYITIAASGATKSFKIIKIE